VGEREAVIGRLVKSVILTPMTCDCGSRRADGLWNALSLWKRKRWRHFWTMISFSRVEETKEVCQESLQIGREGSHRPEDMKDRTNSERILSLVEESLQKTEDRKPSESDRRRSDRSTVA
jgi:hypothetical protein